MYATIDMYGSRSSRQDYQRRVRYRCQEYNVQECWVRNMVVPYSHYVPQQWYNIPVERNAVGNPATPQRGFRRTVRNNYYNPRSYDHNYATEKAPRPKIEPTEQQATSSIQVLCAICLDVINNKEHGGQEFKLTTVLSCKHSFHTPCIEQWLKNRNSCPVCRSSVVLKSHNTDSRSDTFERVVVDQPSRRRQS